MAGAPLLPLEAGSWKGLDGGGQNMDIEMIISLGNFSVSLYEDDQTGDELASILRRLANHLEGVKRDDPRGLRGLLSDRSFDPEKLRILADASDD
jgi:hypothetical protein